MERENLPVEMRLLQRGLNGDIFLRQFRDNNAIPRYAILSHTWGTHGEEVTYDDMFRKKGRDKVGYRKIQFCSEKAAADGLQYFWVDSCCINKSVKAELQHAISSMFRWYQCSAKCYVYMSDVSDQETEGDQEQAFRESRWFTRGWTLQELLAPHSVEFFSKEGSFLGDTRSLGQQVREATGIPETALGGRSLFQFSINERMSWMEDRQTTLQEDMAYSLLGIFGVNMPLRYGEGKLAALKRLDKEIAKLERCLHDLRLTDPSYHKKHIEYIKGGLLEDSYRWVLNNQDFQLWRNDEQSQLLWIKGDPGKGKTMLLCGIIDELEKTRLKTSLLSYFFCEATDSRINNATAVLRGLMYMLVCQRPSLISYIWKRYEDAGKALFEDSNAWFALYDIFVDILQTNDLDDTCLVIDALDECVTADLPKLLGFIVKMASSSSRVKWLVSSRNVPLVEGWLEKASGNVRLCLELNAQSISAAVNVYIRYRVDQLVLERDYSCGTRQAILDHLFSNADNTFLWVALVCEDLKNTPQGLVRARLRSFPPGLNSVYRRMVDQVCESRDAELYKSILAAIAAVYEPVGLTELTTLVEMLEDLSEDVKSIQEIVGFCGSFLVVRDRTVYFLHKSAKDYLLTEGYTQIFPAGIDEVHHEIFLRSLAVISKKLRRDIYNLGSLAYPIEQVQRPEPDPLAASRYACLYWIDHLAGSNPYSHSNMIFTVRDNGPVDIFLREKFLYWLEAVSLFRSMSKGVPAILKLEKLIKSEKASVLSEFVRDAHRFVMSHKQAIEASPLQLYASALLFSPSGSQIRRCFEKEEIDWITVRPHIPVQWSTSLQTLEGHSSTVNSVAFSHNSILLASASDDCSASVWEVSSGALIQTLKGHKHFVSSVAFSHNSLWLASGSGDQTVKIWDPGSGACLQTLKGHTSLVSSVAFSHDSTRLASASDDRTIRIRDTENWKCLHILEDHSSTVSSIVFSHDSLQLVSAAHDFNVRIWDISSGVCLQTFKGHSGFVNSVALSSNSTQIASSSDDSSVKIWDTGSGICLLTLEGHNGSVTSVAFSHDSTRLASAAEDRTVRIWDPKSGRCLQTLKAHTGTVNSVTFSCDSSRLASASHDCTVRIWDVSNDSYLETFDNYHNGTVSAVALSDDSRWFASASYEGTIKLWDVNRGTCLQTFHSGHNGTIHLLTFSHDSTWLASASHDRTIKTWYTENGLYLRTYATSDIRSLAFSYDSKWLAAVSRDGLVKIWINRGIKQQREPFRDGGNWPLVSDAYSVNIDWLAFSDDSAQLVGTTVYEGNRYFRIWKTEDFIPGMCLSFFPSSSENYRYVLAHAITSSIPSIIHKRLETEIQRLQGYIVASSSDGKWITCNSQNVVWIPPEYRPSCPVVAGRMLGVGVGSGKVWLCNLKVSNSLRKSVQPMNLYTGNLAGTGQTRAGPMHTAETLEEYRARAFAVIRNLAIF